MIDHWWLVGASYWWLVIIGDQMYRICGSLVQLGFSFMNKILLNDSITDYFIKNMNLAVFLRIIFVQ